MNHDELARQIAAYILPLIAHHQMPGRGVHVFEFTGEANAKVVRLAAQGSLGFPVAEVHVRVRNGELYYLVEIRDHVMDFLTRLAQFGVRLDA